MREKIEIVVVAIVGLVALVWLFGYLIFGSSPPPPSGPPVVASTTTSTTKAKYFACLSRDELEDMLSFASANDLASGQALIDRGRCVVLKAGVPVTVTGTAGFGKVEFVVKGEPSVHFYAPREAIAGR